MLKKPLTPKEIKTDLKILLIVLLFAASICAGSYLSMYHKGNSFYVSDRIEVRDHAEHTPIEAPQTETATVKKGSLGIVNINTATVSELTSLDGIGKTKAAAIVALRDEIGTFKSVDDLICVNGISIKTLEHLREYITVE